jgi:hypothetical protein
MKRLARQIASDLKRSKISAVYNSELARVFPPTMPAKKRKESIRQFAAHHGLNVEIFEFGLCAIFEKNENKKALKNKPGKT